MIYKMVIKQREWCKAWVTPVTDAPRVNRKEEGVRREKEMKKKKKKKKGKKDIEHFEGCNQNCFFYFLPLFGSVYKYLKYL